MSSLPSFPTNGFKASTTDVHRHRLCWDQLDSLEQNRLEQNWLELIWLEFTGADFTQAECVGACLTGSHVDIIYLSIIYWRLSGWNSLEQNSLGQNKFTWAPKQNGSELFQSEFTCAEFNRSECPCAGLTWIYLSSLHLIIMLSNLSAWNLLEQDLLEQNRLGLL